MLYLIYKCVKASRVAKWIEHHLNRPTLFVMININVVDVQLSLKRCVLYFTMYLPRTSESSEEAVSYLQSMEARLSIVLDNTNIYLFQVGTYK